MFIVPTEDYVRGRKKKHPKIDNNDADVCRDLERKTGLEVFVDMSVSETLYHLIVVGASGGVQQGLDGPQMMAEATALQKRLKVPDKRFWHIKIKVRSGCVRVLPECVQVGV